MVIEAHSAVAAYRTVVCPGSFQTTIAVIFMTGRQFSSFIDTLKDDALLRELFWQSTWWARRTVGHQA
jgi:hypothetical protein